ncbi:MAG: hypothetical protein DMG79_19610 [Acidobacteria bacterium]|nr:MAG: hypothetical protein DMG79_19610 [Acidobacteriota bacterium]
MPVLWSMGALVMPNVVVHVVVDDPDDDGILEYALAAKASLVISGDRHLLTLRKYKSIWIISPRHFFYLLSNSS